MDSTESRVNRLALLLRRLFGMAGREQNEPEFSPVAERADSPGPGTVPDPEAQARLEAVHSTRDMLLYLRDTLWPGLTSWSAYDPHGNGLPQLLDAVNEKLDSLFKEANPCGLPAGCSGREELRDERDELVQRIERLHARYMDAQIEPEKEFSLNQKIQALDQKVKDQNVQLDLLEKKAWALTPYIDAARRLKSGNSMLRSKLEHQSRLLQSLIAANPEQQQLVSTIDSLAVENRRLRMELERKSDLLGQLRKYLPPDVSQILDELGRSHAHLQCSLNESEGLSEEASPNPGEDLLGYMESLSEENDRLQRISEANRRFEDFIKAGGQGDPKEVIEALKRDQREVKLFLDACEERIERTRPTRGMPKAYKDLREEYRHLFVESRCREHLYLQQQDEKKWLQAQARERTTVIQENRKLKEELNTANRQWAELLRESEEKAVAAHRQNAELRARCERLAGENEDLLRERANRRDANGEILLQLEGIFNSKKH